jgi:hypothetical protein
LLRVAALLLEPLRAPPLRARVAERVPLHVAPIHVTAQWAPHLRRLATRPAYSDAKVANREIRVWHFVIKNGY